MNIYVGTYWFLLSIEIGGSKQLTEKVSFLEASYTPGTGLSVLHKSHLDSQQFCEAGIVISILCYR